MITASEIHELKFEKTTFGYKQEEVDEFLNRLEEQVDIANQELADSNRKIQILADKVREYMSEEEAVKDALLTAQKEGHRVTKEAQAKADEIIAQAQARSDAMMEEVTCEHDALLAKNEAEMKAERQKLADMRKEVAAFKKALLSMYKEHLNMISTIPEEDDITFGAVTGTDATDVNTDTDPFMATQFSAKTVQGAYDSRLGDTSDSE